MKAGPATALLLSYKFLNLASRCKCKQQYVCKTVTNTPCVVECVGSASVSKFAGEAVRQKILFLVDGERGVGESLEEIKGLDRPQTGTGDNHESRYC